MFIPEVFENGRVVLIKEEDFQKAIENGQEIWVFCGGWSGGYARAFGASWDGECWQCYSYEIRDKVFTPKQMKMCYKLIVTDGIAVYMMTGEPATEHGIQFIDRDSNYGMSCCRHNLNGISNEEYDDRRKQIDVYTTLCLADEGHYDTDDVKNHLKEMKEDISGILY